jgi:hypothetical protein
MLCTTNLRKIINAISIPSGRFLLNPLARLINLDITAISVILLSEPEIIRNTLWVERLRTQAKGLVVAVT